MPDQHSRGADSGNKNNTLPPMGKFEDMPDGPLVKVDASVSIWEILKKSGKVVVENNSAEQPKRAKSTSVETPRAPVPTEKQVQKRKGKKRKLVTSLSDSGKDTTRRVSNVKSPVHKKITKSPVCKKIAKSSGCKHSPSSSAPNKKNKHIRSLKKHKIRRPNPPNVLAPKATSTRTLKKHVSSCSTNSNKRTKLVTTKERDGHLRKSLKRGSKQTKQHKQQKGPLPPKKITKKTEHQPKKIKCKPQVATKSLRKPTETTPLIRKTTTAPQNAFSILMRGGAAKGRKKAIKNRPSVTRKRIQPRPKPTPSPTPPRVQQETTRAYHPSHFADKTSAIAWETIAKRIGSFHAERMFWYQREALHFVIRHRGRALLALAPGLGKTYTTCLFVLFQALSLGKKKSPFNVLIACPKAILVAWKREVESCFKNTEWQGCAVVITSNKTEFDANKHKVFIMSTHLAKSSKMEPFFRQIAFNTGIVDESQDLGNHQSQITIKLTERLRPCAFRILLSGDPCGGKAIKLFPQCRIVRPDMRIFQQFQEFGMRYAGPRRQKIGAMRDVVKFDRASNKAELNKLLLAHVMYCATRKSIERGPGHSCAGLEFKEPEKLDLAMLERSRCFGGESKVADAPLEQAQATQPSQNEPASKKLTKTSNTHHRQKSVRRIHKIHWLKLKSKNARNQLTDMNEETELLKKAIKEQDKTWTEERRRIQQKVALARKIVSGSSGTVKPNGGVELVFTNECSDAANKLRQTFMDRLIKTAQFKLRLGADYIESLIHAKLQQGKLVIMGLFVETLNTLEARVRKLLDVNKGLPHLNPGRSKANSQRCKSSQAWELWEARQIGALPPDANLVPQPTAALERTNHLMSMQNAAILTADSDEEGKDLVEAAASTKTRKKRTNHHSQPRVSPEFRKKALNNHQKREILPYIRIDGSVTDAHLVAASVDRFQNDPSCRVAILSVPKCSVGMTLTAAYNMIMIGFPLKADLMEQAVARIARAGQPSSFVNVDIIALRGSVDEATWSIVRRKMDDSAQLLDSSTKKADFTYTQVEVDV